MSNISIAPGGSGGGSSSTGSIVPIQFFVGGNIGSGSNLDTPLAIGTVQGSSVLGWTVPFNGEIKTAAYSIRLMNAGTQTSLNIIVNGTIQATVTGTINQKNQVFTLLDIVVAQGDIVSGSFNNAGNITDIFFTFFLEKT